MSKKILVLVMVVLFVVGSGFSYAGVSGNSLFGVVDVDDGNSVVKIMGDVHIEADRVIPGDVVTIMGDIKIDGEIRGNVVAVLGDIEVNNVIQGDVVSVLGNIAKGPNGKIIGQVVEADRPGTQYFPDMGFNPFESQGFNWGMKVFNLITLFALGSITLALIPNNVRVMAASLGSEPFRKLSIGFVAMILTPVIVLVTAISLLGIPLIPFIILAVVAAKFIGYVAVALYVGHRIRTTAALSVNVFIELFLGVLTLWVANVIPMAGFLVYLLITLFALGVVIDTKFGTNNPWFKKKDLRPLSETIGGEDKQD